MPLAYDSRPTKLQDMVGQKHLLGKEGILQKLINTQTKTSCVFAGPPGVGKTTAALIYAQSLNLPFVKLDATTAQTKDIKDAVAKNTTIVIYLDEIQYFNKKQQQSLLSFVESGEIILIAATTENPWGSIYKALLSRMSVFEFQSLNSSDIQERLTKIIQENNLESKFESEAIETISNIASGDLRKALNILELSLVIDKTSISKEDILSLTPSNNQGAFDMSEKVHSELKGAFQKSIRGSSVNASIFYLMRFLNAGDMITPIRRMLVIASEDIGLADPNAVQHTLSCIESAERLGLPEAKYPLTQAVIYLATAPKSNSIGKAFKTASSDIEQGFGTIIPKNIAGEWPKDYIYPHDYSKHWVNQPYMPEDIENHKYWIAGNNKQEQSRKQFIEFLETLE